MVSIKQVEAFYQSAQLGSFVAAAERLNTTQSNISKRIQELEYLLGLELFDRGNRTIRLTAKGQELLGPSKELLDTHIRLRQIGSSTVVWKGPFRFGVTEAVALTWLPRFSAEIQREFPGVIPVATTDTSYNLNELLLQRKIDFAIATERQIDSSFKTIKLYEAERVWVASPRLIDHDRVLTVEEMAHLPMLGHGDISQQRSPIVRYLQSNGISANIVTSCTSISALARMAIDGIGITYLHRNVFAAEIASGELKVLKTDVKIPPIKYVAAYREDAVSPLLPIVAKRAVEICSDLGLIVHPAS
jgi:DNA-binding transcriptional LysR family regulator